MKLSVSLIGSCEKRYHMWYDSSSFCIAFVADTNDNLGGAAAIVLTEAKKIKNKNLLTKK